MQYDAEIPACVLYLLAFVMLLTRKGIGLKKKGTQESYTYISVSGMIKALTDSEAPVKPHWCRIFSMDDTNLQQRSNETGMVGTINFKELFTNWYLL